MTEITEDRGFQMRMESIRIELTASGMPKQFQKEILQALQDNPKLKEEIKTLTKSCEVINIERSNYRKKTTH
jgi:hypothetical protein